MSNPKVSIIIATFNRGMLCERAIKSILAQTYPNLEVIVVDDGSKDDSYSHLEGIFKDNGNVALYQLEKNFGTPAKARNYGILKSSGDYIGFLDDDNVFRPDHVAALVNALERNQMVDFVYGDRWMIFENDPDKNNIGVYHDPDSALLMQRNYIDTSDFLVKREVLFAIGGWDERYKRMLDWNLVARLDKAGYTMIRVPKIITDYYVHDKGMLSDQMPSDNEWFWIRFPGGVVVQGAFDCEIELPYLGEKPQPKVAIFTITWNRLEYTKKSFQSLWNTAGYKFDHYVIDNGSDDGTVEYLKKYEEDNPQNVHVFFNKDNQGIAIASNRILTEIRDSKINYDIIGKFDNDAMCLTNDWLAKIVDIWKVNHKIALSCYISGLKDSAGGVPRELYGRIRNELVGMTRHLGGICCFTSARVRLDFVLDEMETLHTFDDLMFSKYIQEKGYQMGYLENYYINHGVGGTEQIYLDYPEYFKKLKENKTKRYEKTIRGKPEY